MSTYSSPALNGRRGVMLVVHPQLGTVSKTKKYRFGTLPPPPTLRLGNYHTPERSKAWGTFPRGYLVEFMTVA